MAYMDVYLLEEPNGLTLMLLHGLNPSCYSLSSGEPPVGETRRKSSGWWWRDMGISPIWIQSFRYYIGSYICSCV